MRKFTVLNIEVPSSFESSHSAFDVGKKQMRGFGAMISFKIKGGKGEVSKFFKSLKIIKHAGSLGSVDSLVQSPYFMSHSNVP